MTKKISRFNPELIDELIKNYEKPEDLFGKDGIFKELQKTLLERILSSELTTELGYNKHSIEGKNSGNSRNGYSEKTLKGEQGDLTINIPRDRNGDFEPKIIPKNQTRFDGFDEKIISLYARGMTTRDIQEQLKDLYGVEVSATLISNVTNEVIDEVKAWQSRPLDKTYPIVFLDALVIKIQEYKRIINKAFYLALGVNSDGEKELLGIWISQTEGSKFWMGVLTEIKNRGVEDIFIVCVDGLTGFPEAIEAIYPEAQVQLCMVHMVRNSLRYVGWKNRKIIAQDLKTIYSSKTIEEAELALDEFSKKWDKEYPTISKIWKEKWHNITPFFAFPSDIRKAIYTTNAIESINMSLRKVIKNKRVFPSDEAALKQLYLAVKNISKKWTMPIHDWKKAMNCFSIMYEGRWQ
jgi:putative transposase